MHYKTPRLLHMTTAQVAQSVEQRTENPRVGGSIPSLSTISKNLPLRKVFLCSDPIGPNTSVLSGTGLALEPSCAHILSVRIQSISYQKKRMRKIKTYYEIFIKKFHIIQFLKYFFTYSPLLLVLIR